VSRNLTERVTRRPRARRVLGSTLGLMSLLVLTGCSEETTEQWKRLGLPEPGSDRSEYIGDLWIGSWIAAGIVGVFVWGLIIWSVVHYRRRSEDQLPTQVRYNLPIEVLYTIAPVIAVCVLFFFTVEAQNNVLEKVDNPDHEVVVTAQQWSWTFNYVGEDVGDVYDRGTPAEIPELWLVEDESVNFTLHAPDVIHSFWVPSFYFKLDAIPGRDNTFSMTPTTAGEFAGHCAELCGFAHARMIFTVIVTDRASFEEHMQELSDAGQTGILLGGRDSDTVEGLETEEGEDE
jgi:cytochrome c oxidase subunit 2